MNRINNKTLLLVEDDPLMAMVNTKHLEDYGYTVLHAQSSNEAINTVQTNKEIALILMDIDLGDDEYLGTDIAKLILANHNIPLIFLSSHTEKEIVELTENITSYGYVVKNSSATILDASIKMAFRLFEAKEKANLKDRNFHNFISEEDQDLFYLYKKKFIDSNYTNQAKELRKDAPLCIFIHLIYQEAMKFPIHLTLSLSHQNKENSTLRVAFMKYSKEYHQK